MTQRTIQEQVPAPAEQPAAPTGTPQPSQGRADRKKAIVELTDAELQGASGRGVPSVSKAFPTYCFCPCSIQMN